MLLAAVAALLPTACTGQSDAAMATVDPAAAIETNLEGLSADGPYRDPDRAERVRVRYAAQLLSADPVDVEALSSALTGLGFTGRHGLDPASGRPVSLFTMPSTDERAWGTVLVDRSAAHRVVVEVPHPRSDLRTEDLGLSLQRRIPGSVLVIAGAHRDAAGGAADVAHNDGSFFHVLATELAHQGLFQVQVHGFADQSLPGVQAVVSTGDAPVTDLARQVGTGLQHAGIDTCLAWESACGQLEATRNEQGRTSAAAQGGFVHIELNWTIRGDPQRRDLVAVALAERLTAD